MIQNETHRNNLRLHQCRIEKVHQSGLVDARSERDGAFFDRINVLIPGGLESSLQIRDKCVVISDGAMHYVFGKVREPQLDESGASSVRNLNNDLSDLRDSQSIAVDDDFGNQARVIVSKGGGVIADGGEVCVTHWQPGQSKISHYADKIETITPAATVQYTSNGIDAEVNYKFRTMVDPASVNRDYEHNRQDSLDVLGNTVTVDISGGSDLVEFKTRKAGIVMASITIGSDGGMTISSGINGLAEIEVKPTGTVDIKSKALTGGTSSYNAVQVKKDGKIFIGNTVTNLKQQIDLLLDTITQSQTITLLGPSPFIPANAISASIKNLGLPLVLSGTKE